MQFTDVILQDFGGIEVQTVVILSVGATWSCSCAKLQLSICYTANGAVFNIVF